MELLWSLELGVWSFSRGLLLDDEQVAGEQGPVFALQKVVQVNGDGLAITHNHDLGRLGRADIISGENRLGDAQVCGPRDSGIAHLADDGDDGAVGLLLAE